MAAPTTLGNYPATSIVLSADATVTPDAAPDNTTSISVSSSTNFAGELEANPVTGVVRVTNARPAGIHTVTITAFNGGSPSATTTFALTVTTPAVCPQLSFAAAGAGMNRIVQAVVVGDFNGDGNQDVAAAKDTGLSVLLGTGTGQFAAATNITTAGAHSMAVGDFNGDGKQDLAAADDLNADNASIRLGDGAGQFGAPTSLNVGGGARSVALGDFNGDGKQDLALAKSNVGTTTTAAVAILLGDGMGQFGAATFFGPAGDFVSIAAGDFNGDGKQDLAVANQTVGNVSIFLGNGAGSFTSAPSVGAGGKPASVAVGDFNGDGQQDLAVANYSSANVSILLGNGAGGFSAPTNFVAGGGPLSVAVGDFNGDGNQDLAFANGVSANASILLGDGSGAFGAPAYFNVVAGGNLSSVAVGDFNGDGKQDLALPAGGFNGTFNVTILLRDCPAPTPTPSATPATCPVNFAAPENFGVGGFPVSIAVGDFNGDSKADLATVNGSGQGVSVVLGDGTGHFSVATNFAAGADIESVAVGDFDRDFKQDLVVANYSSHQVSVLIGDGAGGFSAPASFATGGTSESIAVGDFNADGKQDLAVPVSSDDDVSILLGNGTGGFGSPLNLFTGDRPTAVVVRDFNGDGKQDLAVANISSNNVVIMIGLGNGVFQFGLVLQAGSLPNCLVAGDFNGDGKQDLVVGHYYQSNVSLFLGLGTGGFDTRVDFATGDGPRSVAVGDFDADGNPDLAVVNADAPNVSILLGDGAGHFSSPIDFLAGDAPGVIAVADFNGDSRPDLAVTKVVLLRECTPRPAPMLNRLTVSAPASVFTGFQFSVTVKAKDQFNTTVAGYPGVAHFTATCPGYLPPDSPLPNGTLTFTATLNQTGSQRISATDISDPSITGTSGPISVTPEHIDTPTPSPTPTPPATPTPTAIPGTLLDTITRANTTTFSASTPRTYMGDGWTNNTIPAGSTSVQITKLTLYMGSATTQAYTNVVARIQFWNNYDAAATPVFTNASGPLITMDLGPLNLTAGSIRAIPVTLATPLILPGGPGTQWGFAQNFQGNTGAGLADTTNLTSLIAVHSNGAYASGQITTGTAPQFGYYRNGSARVDFNFDAADRRTLADLNGQGIAIVIFGTAQGGETPTPTPTATPSATASASPLPTGTISPPAPAQSLNLSSRLLVQTGDGVGIAGFIISGSAPKRVILRAVHCQVCIPEVSPLADPMLELHPSGGGATIVNDNWRDTQEAEIIGTGLVPDNESDSAIVATLSPGNHTAIVRGKNNTAGVALIEVYDLDQAAASKLANISTRAFVSTGGDILIAGFILGNGTLPDNVIVRGIGPSLGGLGVANTLADPRLELRDSNGTLVRSNNNWQDDPAQAALLSAAGLAPSNTLESGIAAPLSPGQYTALLAGSNNGTGVGLVEVYDLGNQ